MTAKLEVGDVRISYVRRRFGDMLVAVSGLSFDVGDGEFVAIVGPSGCGKTTFLSAVDGLVPINRGTLLLDGKAITAPGPDRALSTRPRDRLEIGGFGLARRIDTLTRSLQ